MKDDGDGGEYYYYVANCEYYCVVEDDNNYGSVGSGGLLSKNRRPSPHLRALLDGVSEVFGYLDNESPMCVSKL